MQLMTMGNKHEIEIDPEKKMYGLMKTNEGFIIGDILICTPSSDPFTIYIQHKSLHFLDIILEV